MEQTKAKTALAYPSGSSKREYENQGLTKAQCNSIHQKLRSKNQKKGICNICKKENLSKTEWSLIHGHIYSTDINSYEELCILCHRNKDTDLFSSESQSKKSIGKFGEKHNSSKPILQYHKNGDFIKEWGSCIDAIRSLGLFNQTTLCNHLNGRKPSAHGYIWKFKTTNDE